MKLTNLRLAMSERGISAYIIPGSDAHQSEWIAEYWCTRHWLSGFTGSNGLVVVAEKEAGLWTDGRYYIQAEQELSGSGIKLFRMSEPGVPSYGRWLADNLPDEAVVGFDGRVLSISEFSMLKKELAFKKCTYLYDEDLAGSIWTNRPALPTSPIFAHDLRFTGKSAADKLKSVRAKMEEKSADILLTTALDDIAWLANIRGSDIANTPVVYAYLIVSMEKACLFIDEQKVDEAMRSFMSDFEIFPYEDIFEHVARISNAKLMINPQGLSVRLYDSITDDVEIIKGPSIISGLKAVKNEVEIKNSINAFKKEGVVMVRFLKWLSEISPETQDEAHIKTALSQLRLSEEHCLGDSFNTIAAYGENAASAHYNPMPGKCAKLKSEGFFLVDTGGQYLDGTTDITRTIVMGEITDEMRRDYTLVLKGNIALSRAKFLQGTRGVQLDILARQYLWQAGLDYKHGTGHGLGFCLGVHEGPQNISQNIKSHELEAGMLCSNEPGLYKEGHYGIRIENIVLVKEVEKTEYGTFLGFETLSLCPIDTLALDMSLLDKIEIEYLNDYHRRVYEELSPLLSKEEAVWLKEATNPVA